MHDSAQIRSDQLFSCTHYVQMLHTAFEIVKHSREVAVRNTVFQTKLPYNWCDLWVMRMLNSKQEYYREKEKEN